MRYFITFFLYSQFIFGNESSILATIKKRQFKVNNLGIYVEQSGKKLVEIDANKKMVPASLTKIITGAAILKHFPLNFKFTTELKSKADIENGILKGDLCLVGGGDPSFVSEKMWFLVNEFSRNQIKEISGNIIVDSQYFDSEIYDKGRDKGRVDRAFDAPISATSFNWNSANVFVRPAKNPGESAVVFIDPENRYLELENNTKTGNEVTKTNIEVSRVTEKNKDKIIVSGQIKLNSPELVFYKGITDPNSWSGEHLFQFLKQRDIQVKGKVLSGNCDQGAKTFAKVDSKNLVEMVSDMLKFSNNYVAEMLVKNLGAQIEKPGKMSNGILKLEEYLTSIGIEKSDYVLENVSGLTRENKFTAKQLAKVLSAIKSDYNIYPEFLSGLPVAGIDGTLKNRLKNQSSIVVRAKTGYLDGVIGLAGYIAKPNQDPLIFVFMYNGGVQDGLMARGLFDELIAILKK